MASNVVVHKEIVDLIIAIWLEIASKPTIQIQNNQKLLIFFEFSNNYE